LNNLPLNFEAHIISCTSMRWEGSSTNFENSQEGEKYQNLNFIHLLHHSYNELAC